MIANVCSSARLSSQLKGLSGNADLVIIGLHLDSQWSKKFEQVRCTAIINKEQANLSRQSSMCPFGSFPQWNESFTFRCFPHWGVEFIVSGKDQRDELQSDLISFQQPGICTVPVRYGAKCVGELQISVAFRPNYRSFKYLAIGCNLSEQLSFSLTNSILAELNTNSIEDKMHAIASEEDIIRIITAVDNFTTFLTQDVAYTGELCLALKLKTSYNGKLHNPPDEKDPHNYRSLLTQENPSLPKTIPLHKVAIGAKNFLSKLLDDLPQPPPVTINLIEKQLTIFTQSLLIPVSSPLARDTVLTFSSTSSSSSSCDSTAEDRELHLTWAQFAQFCTVAALWFLQQAVAANTLLARCSNLTLPELDALRFGFSQYDTDLSGVISTADLYALLQDMGEEYNETELGLTACYLDPDSLGYLEFADFVLWWCE